MSAAYRSCQDPWSWIPPAKRDLCRGPCRHRLSNDGQSTVQATGVIACQGLAVSGGFNPTNDLYSQAGGQAASTTIDLACFVPEECRQRVTVAGAAHGKFSLADALADGARAGF